MSLVMEFGFGNWGGVGEAIGGSGSKVFFGRCQNIKEPEIVCLIEDLRPKF